MKMLCELFAAMRERIRPFSGLRGRAAGELRDAPGKIGAIAWLGFESNG